MAEVMVGPDCSRHLAPLTLSFDYSSCEKAAAVVRSLRSFYRGSWSKELRYLLETCEQTILGAGTPSQPTSGDCSLDPESEPLS